MTIIKLENDTNILHFKILESETEEVVLIYTNNIIPESILYQSKTYFVTQIGDNINPVNGTLSELTIPSSVLTINNYAFNSNLTKLFFIFSDEVFIRENTFARCSPKIFFIKSNVTPSNQFIDKGSWNNLLVEFIDYNDKITIISELDDNYAIVRSVITDPINQTIIIPNYIIKDYGPLTINNFVLQNRKKYIPVTKISTDFLNENTRFTINTIYIPYNITIIESLAFNNYQYLRNIYFAGVPSDIKIDSFYNFSIAPNAYFYKKPILFGLWYNLNVNARDNIATDYVRLLKYADSLYRCK
jgi:hypothetical protein